MHMVSVNVGSTTLWASKYVVYIAVDTTSCVITMRERTARGMPARTARGGNLCTLRDGRKQPLHIALLQRGCDRHTSLPLTRNSTTPTSSVAIHLPVTYADQGFYFAQELDRSCYLPVSVHSLWHNSRITSPLSVLAFLFRKARPYGGGDYAVTR